MASKSAGIKLRGRFPAGTQVRLVRVEGPHVMRPGPQHETVDTQKVDKDGVLEFKGVEAGERYFAVGLNHGFPVEVRLTGKADPDTANHAEMYGDNGLYQRVKLSDGSFLDEDPEQHQDTNLPEGATWLGQHQVPKGTLQRSDTPRGSAHPISQEERDRAETQWRKQEPTQPVVEEDNSLEPADDTARTAEPAPKKTATTTKKGS